MVYFLLKFNFCAKLFIIVYTINNDSDLSYNCHVCFSSRTSTVDLLLQLLPYLEAFKLKQWAYLLLV